MKRRAGLIGQDETSDYTTETCLNKFRSSSLPVSCFLHFRCTGYSMSLCVGEERHKIQKRTSVRIRKNSDPFIE